MADRPLQNGQLATVQKAASFSIPQASPFSHTSYSIFVAREIYIVVLLAGRDLGEMSEDGAVLGKVGLVNAGFMVSWASRTSWVSTYRTQELAPRRSLSLATNHLHRSRKEGVFVDLQPQLHLYHIHPFRKL